MRPKSVYDGRSLMKIQATLALLLVVSMSFLRFCPACDEASLREQAARSDQASAAAPMAGHACCQKETAPEPPGTPSPEDGDSRDCGREHVSAILRVAVPETAPDAYSVTGQDMALALSPLMTEPAVREALAVSPEARADSPPTPILSLPIRI
jgi:hypothetical protein